MEIKFVRPPAAGQPFAFTVINGYGTTRISVFIGAQEVHTIECDDPPCHEVFLIPANAGGSMLKIFARDEENEVKTITERILNQ